MKRYTPTRRTEIKMQGSDLSHAGPKPGDERRARLTEPDPSSKSGSGGI